MTRQFCPKVKLVIVAAFSGVACSPSVPSKAPRPVQSSAEHERADKNCEPEVGIERESIQVIAVTAAANSFCALGHNGEVICWGRNDSSPGAESMRAPFWRPSFAKENGTFVPRQVVGGGDFYCALDSSGKVACWGGAVPGSKNPRSRFVVFHDFGRFRHLAAGAGHVCGLTFGGSVTCWGANHRGQLGYVGERLHEPPSPLQLGDVVVNNVYAGGRHTCIVSTEGELRCFGDNTFRESLPGATGVSAEKDVAGPLDPAQPVRRDVVDVAPGQQHTCALVADGKVSCWGDRPEVLDQVSKLDSGEKGSGVLELQSKFFHTCARLEGDSIACWGGNEIGQLGAEDPKLLYNVLQVEARQLAVGGASTCVLNSDGEVRCWGANEFGQLGFIGEPASGELYRVEFPPIERRVELECAEDSPE